MTKHLPYSRADRIATEIHHVVAEYIHNDLDDPRVAGVLITQVKLTKDLRLARIHFFLRGSDMQRRECQAGLEQAAGRLKHAINQQIVMRYMPALEFHFDETIEHAERIEDLLQEIHKEES